MELLFALALLPSIILGWIIWQNDKIEKEPTSLLIILFLCGVGSTIVTLLLSIFVYMIPLCNPETASRIIEHFVSAVIGVALVEEFSKWIFIKVVTWKNKEFTHIYDAVVYAVFVSLGFATVENLLYVFSSEGAIMVAIARALLAVPLHVFCGVFMGYYYGLAKQSEINNRNNLKQKNLLLSIIIPTLTHGFYDFCLFTGDILFFLLFLIFVVTLYILAFIRINKLSKIQVPLRPVRPLFCTNCGTPGMGNYCANCGNKIKKDL